MSNRYKGGVISATPPTTTGGESGTASGAWTLEQQMQLTAAGLWPIQPLPKYIEDVFSTYLYTGNGSTQTITNGINLSANGGLVWSKCRNTTGDHEIVDTVRGAQKGIYANTTGAQVTNADVNGFTTSGYTLGYTTGYANVNGNTYASWTFREQTNFFDIVTYTGNGAASRNISHALGSKPGFVVIKRTDSTGNWFVAAWRGTTFLVGTDALPFAFNSSNGYNLQNGAAATSTTFDPNEVTISSNYGVTPSNANINGATYVAYLWATNAGGFGAAGTDNIISCGTFSTNGSGLATVNLGYEPQFLLMKAFDASSWWIFDTMRNWNKTNYAELNPNLSAAESNASSTDFSPTATGFQLFGNVYGASRDFVYMAVRRGPMKVPTDATKVFLPVTYTGNGGTQTITSNFPVDLTITDNPTKGSAAATDFKDRLRGSDRHLGSQYDYAEQTEAASFIYYDRNTSVGMGVGARTNNSGVSYVTRMLQRAPSFFDEVCYTGNGTAGQTYAHNLGVVPELMIVKRRNAAREWNVYAAPLGATKFMFLNTQDAVQTDLMWNDTAPTSSVFTVGSYQGVNASASTYVAYLFATCAGVSKVGSYTGTGATQTINCGFTGGARFVVIKRTDSTGGWYNWDTARGMVSGTDPSLFFNATSAEVNTNSVFTIATGFQIVSTDAGINASGGTYIFLAIA